MKASTINTTSAMIATIKVTSPNASCPACARTTGMEALRSKSLSSNPSKPPEGTGGLKFADVPPAKKPKNHR